MEFIGRTTVKAQALADFSCEPTRLEEEALKGDNQWIEFVDGSSGSSGGGVGGKTAKHYPFEYGLRD